MSEGPLAPIVVPAHLRKLYESAMSTYDEAKALKIVRNICDNISGFDGESLELMNVAEEKRWFAVDRLTDAMWLTCPKDVGTVSRGKPKLTISDLKAGCCTSCKTPIVLEWKVV